MRTFVDRGAGAHFGGKFVDGETHDERGFEFFLVGLAGVGPAAREDVFGDGAQGGEFFFTIFHRGCCPQDHDRAVIHRVIENRAREHEAIEQRDGHADRNSLIQVAQHSARGGTVDVEVVARATVGRRNHEWLVVYHKTDVTDEALVKDLVSGCAIVDTAVRLADYARARTGTIRFRHDGFPGVREDEGVSYQALGSRLWERRIWTSPSDSCYHLLITANVLLLHSRAGAEQ